MNKGISLSSGDWICFMNSNDHFYNDTVIEDVFSGGTDGDIIYGYCIDPDTGKSVNP
jgi:glycosyltransferase involved in cell wall biosynthesis